MTKIWNPIFMDSDCTKWAKSGPGYQRSGSARHFRGTLGEIILTPHHNIGHLDFFNKGNIISGLYPIWKINRSSKWWFCSFSNISRGVKTIIDFKWWVIIDDSYNMSHLQCYFKNLLYLLNYRFLKSNNLLEVSVFIMLK